MAGPAFISMQNEVSYAGAAVKKYQWIGEYQVKILNCAGSRASKDPKIYYTVFSTLDKIVYKDCVACWFNSQQNKGVCCDDYNVPAIGPLGSHFYADLNLHANPCRRDLTGCIPHP